MRARFLLTASTGKIQITAANSAGTTILDITTSSINDGSWHHIMFSVDLSDTGKRHLYVDDADDLTVNTYTNDSIDFTTAEHAVGAYTTGAAAFDGDLADFWFDFGTYIDLSVASNRRKFVGASAASSVDLGSDGSNPTGSAPIVFFSGATSTWHTNDGTGGGFTENGALTDASANPPDYGGSSPTASGTLAAQAATVSGSASITGRAASGTLQAGSAAISGEALRAAIASGAVAAQLASLGGETGYEPQGVNFDGSTYLTRGADLTGNADSKLVTWSFWFLTSGNNIRIYTNALDSASIQVRSDGTLRFWGTDSSTYSTGFFGTTSNAYNDGAWHHCMGAVDTSDSGKRHVYIDDTAESMTWGIYTNAAADFTTTDHVIGASDSFGNKYNGDLSDFWYGPSQYIDLSVEANRRKFIDASGNAVDLGSDGSTPTGTAPLIYLHGATATWHTNDGTGGGFTENGTLTDASTNPPSAPDQATAVVTKKASGTPAAQDASTTGAVSRTAKASGAPAAQDASTSGAASRTAKASGTPAAQAASIVGAATIFVQGIATGTLQAGAAAISGAASRTAKASGAVESGLASLSGAAELVHKASGALATGASSIAGVAVRTAKASGTLASGVASIVGRMVINIVRPEIALLSMMRDTAVRAESSMSEAPVALSGEMSDTLALTSMMRDTAVRAVSAMSDDSVVLETELAP